MDNGYRYSSAVLDFRRARRQANLQGALARLSGRSERLLSFDEIRKKIGEDALLPRGLQEIPLDAIVGSVGRYEDFNRRFLPRQQAQEGRWARVRIAMEGKGLPPIEVYKLGEVYFVLDGHHRASVARQVGAESIEAYVTEIPTRVPLKPEDDADAIILKSEQARFLADTRLDETRPDIDLTVTAPGAYWELREHIAVHRYYKSRAAQGEIPVEEAAASWVDEVYAPARDAIRGVGLLRDFPNRTETDLYLWLMKHREELGADLGWELEPGEAAEDLGRRFSRRAGRIWSRFRAFLYDLFTPDRLEGGPRPGRWRLSRQQSREDPRLFPRLLVALSGDEASRPALEGAVLVAQREGARLRGLHVLGEGEAESSERVSALRAEFERRLAEAGLKGRLVVEGGQVPRVIEDRAQWCDLLVVHLQHPPGEKPGERLRSGMRTLIRRAARPLLLVPQATAMQRALLAYDGSSKAREALYVAAYLAQSWGAALTVLVAQEGEKKSQTLLDEARDYLSAQGVEAEYLLRKGPAGPAVLQTAANQKCDLILMGGYGAAPLVEVAIGSTLDQVLRGFPGPVLVCR